MNRVLRPGGSFYISEPCRDATPSNEHSSGSGTSGVWYVRERRTKNRKSVEEPLAAAELRAQLRRLGFQFEMRFLTHLPPLQGALSERAYVRAVRLVSFPWRRSKGDLLFVFGP